MEHSNGAFTATSDAIKNIKDSNLRRDFADLLAGVDYALASDDIDLANDCLVALRTLARSLCRTIGGDNAVAIIEGLGADCDTTKTANLRAPTWTNGKICDVGGTATCISRANNKCNQSSTGCISTGSGIQAGYVWGVAMLTA